MTALFPANNLDFSAGMAEMLENLAFRALGKADASIPAEQRRRRAALLAARWLRRIALLKRVEARVMAWHGGDDSYRIFSKEHIHSFSQLEKRLSAGQDPAQQGAFCLLPPAGGPAFVPLPEEAAGRGLAALDGLGPRADFLLDQLIAMPLPEHRAAPASLQWLARNAIGFLTENHAKETHKHLKLCLPFAEESPAFETLAAAWLHQAGYLCASHSGHQPVDAKGRPLAYRAAAGPGGYRRTVETALSKRYAAAWAAAGHFFSRQLFAVAPDTQSAEQLQLSAELLMSAFLHYLPESSFERLPAWPDMTGQIKSGSALGYSIAPDTGLLQLLEGNRARAGLFSAALRRYQQAESSDARAEAREILSDLAQRFLKASAADWRRLRQLESELAVAQANLMFSAAPALKSLRIGASIARLRARMEKHDAIEWRVAFPDSLQLPHAQFVGFDMVMICPPAHTQTEDAVALGLQLARQKHAVLALRLPEGFLQRARNRGTALLLAQAFECLASETLSDGGLHDMRSDCWIGRRK